MHPLRNLILAKVFLITIQALIVWALTTYTPREANKGSLGCAARTTPAHEIIGNAGFYGLGIRLGVYLQWTSSVLARSQRQATGLDMALAGSYCVVTTSLLVGLLLLTLRDNTCTFTAEIVVIIVIVWGGYMVVLLPLESSTKPRAGGGTESAAGLLLRLILPINLWFWIRAGMMGPGCFAESPSGSTAIFFFARIGGHGGFVAVSWLVASATLWIMMSQVFYMFGAIFEYYHLRPLALLMDCLIPLFALQILYELSKRCLKHLKYNEAHAAEDDSSSTYSHCPTDADEPASSSSTRTIINCIILAWHVLAIELTLAWNNIIQIYQVSSTGQVIPLIGGIGVLIGALWAPLRVLAKMSKLRDVLNPAKKQRLHDDPERESQYRFVESYDVAGFVQLSISKHLFHCCATVDKGDHDSPDSLELY